MEDIEIEYLDEYKDLVLPGIKTSSDRSAATGAISYQVPLPRRRRISSDSSGSSSIDPDIFQKLFDGKLLEDEMLTESGSNAKGRSRRRLSSPSSDSNDALDALYNRQVNKRRDRFESYDSIDDLGDVLMGATHRSLARTNSQPAKKSASDGLQRGRGGSIVAKSKSAESRPQANKSNLSVASMKPSSKTDSLKLGFRTNGTSSSSCKKAITIIKAQKPDLKPPKHEPKEDPLHLEDFSDDSDSDLSYEYESDFYGYGDSEDEDGEGSKHIIDISTDSNTVADTVTPVVSDDESQLQLQQQQTLHAATERLHLYLNNQSGARKSRSNEKSFSTSKTTDNNDVVDQALPMAEQSQRDGLSSSSRVSDKKPRADHVDDNNLTYEKLGRFSQNLTAKIIKTDADRSIEFKKRSGSKQRSISPSKLLANSSLYANHVRKLTYTNEKIDEIAPMRRTKSDEAFAKRGRCGRQSKSRAATTDEQSKCNSLSPTKITSTETTLTTTTEKEKESPNKEPSLNTKSPAIPEKIKRKRGRPKKKKFPSANASVSENQTEKPTMASPLPESQILSSGLESRSGKRLLKDDLALAKKPTQNRNSPCISDKTSEECSDSSANSKELYINNNNDETPQQSTVENKVAEIAKDEIESLSERHLRSSKASTTATLAKNPSRKQPLKTAKDDGKGDVVLTEKKSRRTRQKKNIEKPIEAEVLPEGTIVDKIHIETITALVDEIPLSAEAPQLKADIAKLADVANIEIETLDSIDQSEIVERSIEKRIPIEDSKNHSSQAVENQVTSDSDDMQLALVPDTHITCSSSGSCRKLRVLLKRVEAKSKTTLCHKFENYVDPPQQELEDITQDTPTEVVTFFHQDQATAANKEPTDSGPSAGKDESSENIDPCETTEKSTDQSPFESQPKQTIVDQEQLSNDENESVIEEQKPVEEDADKDLPQNKTESEEKLQAETEEGAEKNVQKIGVENKEQQPVDETFDEHKDEQPIDAEMKEQQPKPIETEAREQPEQDEKEDIPEKDQQPQETKEYAAGIDQQLLDERVSATKDQPLIETDSKPDQAAGSEQPQTDNFTTQLNPTETTGVVRSVDGVSTVEGCINSVSSEAEANVDASQPDG
ncbi:GH20079 [Drosophila grimshawi]|uniref:GH20079 n=1 Tax=Drosophila grimshawi TaxID=7222 RepID=B4J785_DROGR|nr:GH20079 [Drosophila grimshawi]